MVYIWSSYTNLYLFIPRFFCLTKPQDISSQLVPWLTRTQVKQYLGSPLVTSHLVMSWLFNNYWWKLVPKHILYYIKIFKIIFMYTDQYMYLFTYYALNVQLDGQKMKFCVLISGIIDLFLIHIKHLN